VIKKPRKQGG